jgi:ABC-type polysaccharide/polyol phosphate export permease
MSSDVEASPASPPSLFGDFREAYAKRRLCWMLAYDDVRRRYRRSVLGPLWVTLSMGFMILAMGLLYGAILGVPLDRYFPYLAASLVLWALISAALSESTVCFVESGMLARQMPLPWSLFVARLVLRNLLAFAHNAILIVVVLAIFRQWPGWPIVILPLSLLLVTLLLTFAGLLLAVIGTRFRDMGPIIQNVLQVTFFMTPILWMPDSLAPGRAAIRWLVDLNPFHHLLDIVRRPLLGQWPDPSSLGMVALLVVLVAMASLWAFGRARARLIFWC